MPPKRFKKKSVKWIVEKRVAKAIEEYEKTRADSNNTGGFGSGGTVAPDVHGCSYKTFTNGKPHTFNGTEGVVGLKHWFEKIEQVFEICKCAEEYLLWTLTLNGDDIEATTIASMNCFDVSELVSTERKIESNSRISRGNQGNVLLQRLRLCMMQSTWPRRTFEQGFKAKALRIGDSNKKKWETSKGTLLSQHINQGQEVLKVYVAAPIRVEVRWELTMVQ
ncbi:hypothetical protein Tco_0027058 [Tanacetum coccineum]